MSSERPEQASRIGALAEYSLGQKLKTLRAERGLTLASLGAETKLSTALLSKLESERMTPTLQTLAKICRVYGVDLGFFFASPGQQFLAITVMRISLPTAAINPRRSECRFIASHTIRGWYPRSRMFREGPRSISATRKIGLNSPPTTAGVVDVLCPGDCAVLDTNGRVFWTAPDSRCRVLAVFAR